MVLHEQFTLLPNNQVKCKLCEVLLENGDLIEVHLHDKKHKDLYMRNLMACNSIIIAAPDLFCLLCNSNVETSQLTDHLISKSHQNKLTLVKELVLQDGDFIKLPTLISNCSLNCTICDIKVQFTYDMLKGHTTSPIHGRVKSMVLQPLNGIFSVEGTDKYLWCKICQIFFDNYVELIIRHVEETDHALKIGKLLRLINEQNIDIDIYLQNFKEDKAFCKKCCIEVPCNIDNLQSHVRGKKHKNS